MTLTLDQVAELKEQERKIVAALSTAIYQAELAMPNLSIKCVVFEKRLGDTIEVTFGMKAPVK